MKYLIFILLAIFCLGLTRNHHRHISKKVIARAAETLKLMSTNMKIRADMKAMGLLGLQNPKESVDDQDQTYGKGYSEELALNIWRVAQITYCDQKAIRAQQCLDPNIPKDKCVISQYQGKLKNDTLRVFNNKNEYFSRAFVAWDEQKSKLGVAFRGTVATSGKNWFTNLSIGFTKQTDQFSACSADPIVLQAKPITTNIPMTELLNQCQVHNGFQQISNDLAVNQGMEQYIQDMLNQNYKGTPIEIMVTGHSLGAAQAVLYSYRLLKKCAVWKANDGKQLCKLQDVYHFCAPRVGNEAFTEIYNSVFKSQGVNVWRIMHGHDAVPQIPLLVQDYRHTGSLVYYQKYDKANLNPKDMNHLTRWSKPKFCGFTKYDLTASSVAGAVWYSDKEYALRGAGEFDPHCMYLIGVSEKSIADHSNIFNKNEQCDALVERRTRHRVSVAKYKGTYRSRFALIHHRLYKLNA